MSLKKPDPEALCERQVVIENIRKWGGPTTDAILDPSCHHFMDPSIEGLIGYQKHAKHAVVWGDPVCAPENQDQLVHTFETFCHNNRLTAVYLIASEQFKNQMLGAKCSVCIQFGEKLSFDPHCNPLDQTGPKASLVRRKVKQALKEEVSVHEYLGDHPQLEKAMEKVGELWLKKRKGPQIHISHVRLFCDRSGKRWFYAKQGENIVGVLSLNQLQAHSGWLMNHLMITPTCPHGTPELLVTSTLQGLAQEGCHFVTCGAIPGQSLTDIEGLNPFSTWMASSIFRIARKFFKLDGKRVFWDKFHPETEKCYLLFKKSVTPRALIALMRACNVSL